MEFMLTLEETLLFRKHCILLRVMNCMFMNFIRNEEKALSSFFGDREAENKLVELYNDAERKGHHDHASDYQAKICKLIIVFFEKLHKVRGCEFHNMTTIQN
jgi:hypothetical protein